MTKKASILAALIVVFVIGVHSQTTPAPKHHAVFQMTEAQGPDWGLLIAHVTNVRDVLKKDGGSQMEIVFYGPGLNMLKKTNTEYEERLKQLAESGVTLAACQNAMKFMNLKTEDLFPFAAQVDSGIAELIRKQEAGWAYIH